MMSVQCYTYFSAVGTHFPGFPELEIVGCPARYDCQNEVYIVDFQWNVPFSPAALDHIELLIVHADVLLNLPNGVNDFTLLRPQVFDDTLPVNVSYMYMYFP